MSIYKYFLHFVGRGLYSKEEFIIESEKFGVNRALPKPILRKMKFGEKILLAQYEPQKLNKDGGISEFPKAVVFGYYTIHGLNFDAWENEEFRTKLVSQLDLVSESIGRGNIKRKCGSYIIGASYVVLNELDDIIAKVEKLEKEMGVNVKVFVAGSFKQLAMKEISPIKFSRSGTFVEFDRELEGEVKDKCVGFIGDYKQRKYFLKDKQKTIGNEL